MENKINDIDKDQLITKENQIKDESDGSYCVDISFKSYDDQIKYIADIVTKLDEDNINQFQKVKK